MRVSVRGQRLSRLSSLTALAALISIMLAIPAGPPASAAELELGRSVETVRDVDTPNRPPPKSKPPQPSIKPPQPSIEAPRRSIEAPRRSMKPPRPFILEPGDRDMPEFLFSEVLEDGSLREWGFVEFRGRPIIAVSWATWCGVCRRDLPRLDRLQALLGKEGFLVATLSIDDMQPAKVAKELRARGQKRLRVFHDTDKLFFLSTSGVGVPSTIIANRHGKVVARAQGSVRWDDPEIIEFVRRITDSPAPFPADSARLFNP